MDDYDWANVKADAPKASGMTVGDVLARERAQMQAHLQQVTADAAERVSRVVNESGIRMECLKLASASMNSGEFRVNGVAVARDLAAFVLGQDVQKA